MIASWFGDNRVGSEPASDGLWESSGDFPGGFGGEIIQDGSMGEVEESLSEGAVGCDEKRLAKATAAMLGCCACRLGLKRKARERHALHGFVRGAMLIDRPIVR